MVCGVEVITGKVPAVLPGKATKAENFVAIPYFTWANRGMGEMAVWLPRTPEKATALPVSLPPNIAKVESSGGVEKKWTGYNDQNDDIAAVYDGAQIVAAPPKLANSRFYDYLASRFRRCYRLASGLSSVGYIVFFGLRGALPLNSLRRFGLFDSLGGGLFPRLYNLHRR